MECEKYLVMKCNYIMQINQHLLSLYLVIFKHAVLPVLLFTHIILKVFILLTLHYLYLNLHSINLIFNIQNFSDGIYLKDFFSTFPQWVSFPFVDIILYEILSIELTKYLAADIVPNKIS
jgi:hypothetical protein